MSQYFPKPCNPFGEDTNVKVDLSNYVTKVDFDLKKASGTDAPKLALKANLTNLKAEVDKIYVDKLNFSC